ncbi:MAG: Pr6Pr family membrane protein, partial [Oscillospiraceae bacterium]
TSIGQMTFISNFSVGCFFITASIIKIVTKKELPVILYLDCTMMLFLVFAVCMAFISDMNFNGAFFLLHVTNPLIVLIIFMIFTDLSKLRKRCHILTVMIFPVVYLIFAQIYGSLTRRWIYLFINPDYFGMPFVICFIIISAVSLLLLAFIVYYFNIKLHKNDDDYEKNVELNKKSIKPIDIANEKVKKVVCK